MSNSTNSANAGGVNTPKNPVVSTSIYPDDGLPTFIRNTTDFQKSMDDIQKFYEQSKTVMETINEYVADTNQIGLISSMDSARMALKMASYEAFGLSAQLEMNDMATAMNVQSDISQLGVRNAMMLSSKSYETAILIAQFREKMLQMFITLTEQRTNNTWSRIKNLTQGFKF
jgi:hypothetical protein